MCRCSAFVFRAVSRMAMLAMTLLAGVPAGVQGQDRPPTKWQAMAREILAELIAINTTEANGSTTQAAEVLRGRLLAAGFPAGDVVVVGDAPRKGNLVARMRGRETGRAPILLLAHLDVVEAHPEDWTLPPFELIERDGIFYGRGTADDKDEAAIHVTNLIRMKEEGFVPDRDIIVALTADEEGGPDNGVRWLLANRRELIDAEFAFNEGGGGLLDEAGRPVANTVQASEKKVQNFTLEATNPGGHSSRPRPDNAIYDLAGALVRIGQHAWPVRLNEVTRAFLERQATLVDAETARAMRALLVNPADAAATQHLARTSHYNAILRTTCVATLIEGGHARNALPQRAQATVNCRILPDESPDDVQRALVAAAGEKVTVTPVSRATDSPPSPLREDVLGIIEGLTNEMWPGVPVVPIMSTGATDGLFLRNAGIPVYGVSGLFYGETFSHGMNERIPVQAFHDGLEFLYRLVVRVAGGRSTAP